MALHGGDNIRIELRDGLELVICAQPDWTPYMAFAMAWGCSVLMEGKPVCLKNLLPGMTLHIATRLQVHPGLPEFMAAAWPHTLEQIQAWRLHDDEPCFSLSLPYSRAVIALADHPLPPAAVHIEWRQPFITPFH